MTSMHNRNPTTESVQGHFVFLKNYLSLQVWAEYKSNFYSTYLRERTESFNTDPKSL